MLRAIRGNWFSRQPFFFYRAYAQFPKNQKYVFVDDTINNLLVPSLLPNWKCIQFADKPNGPFLNVRSIWELTLMLNTISRD